MWGPHRSSTVTGFYDWPRTHVEQQSVLAITEITLKLYVRLSQRVDNGSRKLLLF